MLKRPPPDVNNEDGEALQSKRCRMQARDETDDKKDNKNDSACRLLLLPRELRDEIFRSVYGASTKQLRPLHPYDPYPTLPPPTEENWLLILNRQLGAESQTLFDKEYDQTFYFEDVPTLHDFVLDMRHKNIAPRSKFRLRRRTDMPCEQRLGVPLTYNLSLTDGVGKQVRDFIESQPGFCYQYGCALGYHPWGIADLNWLWQRKATVQRLKFREVGHENCSGKQSDCRRHFMCEYPPLDGSLRLRGYAWELPKSDFKADVEYAGGLVLEGEIRDVSFKRYEGVMGSKRLAADRIQVVSQAAMIAAIGAA